MKDRQKKIKPCNGNCGCGGGAGQDAAKAACDPAEQLTESTYSGSTVMQAYYIGQDIGHIDAAREERMSALNALLAEKAL